MSMLWLSLSGLLGRPVDDLHLPLPCVFRSAAFKVSHLCSGFSSSSVPLFANDRRIWLTRYAHERTSFRWTFKRHHITVPISRSSGL